MTLSKRTYLFNWDDEVEIKAKDNASDNVKKAIANINASKMKEVISEAGYWRKANHIHRWFVDNVQNGEDDCGTYTVSLEQLKELKRLCREVIKSSELVPTGKTYPVYDVAKGKEVQEKEYKLKDSSVAEELLPTQSGFFFGGTEFDKWYVEDLKATVKIVNACLKDDMAEYEYHSSW